MAQCRSLHKPLPGSPRAAMIGPQRISGSVVVASMVVVMPGLWGVTACGGSWVGQAKEPWVISRSAEMVSSTGAPMLQVP
jgi:hypothetical protein